MSNLTYEGFTLTAKDGLLIVKREVVPLPLADTIARHHGFAYAEQLVKHLEKLSKGDRKNG